MFELFEAGVMINGVMDWLASVGVVDGNNRYKNNHNKTTTFLLMFEAQI